MKCRRLCLAGVTLLLCCHAQAASPYYSFQSFENGPPTEFSTTSGGTIESVSNGTAGINASPNGGTHFGRETGHVEWYFSAPQVAPGSFSFQFDVFADPSVSYLTYIATVANRPGGALASFDFYNGFVGNTRLSDYYYNEIRTTISNTPVWRTVEVAYVPGTTINPDTGNPYLDFVLNVYQDVSINSEGYRSGTLLQGFRVVYNNYDFGGKVDVPATISPSGIELTNSGGSGKFSYFDNIAIGPFINTPEPSSTAALLFSCAAWVRRTRRRA